MKKNRVLSNTSSLYITHCSLNQLNCSYCFFIINLMTLLHNAIREKCIIIAQFCYCCNLKQKHVFERYFFGVLIRFSSLLFLALWEFFEVAYIALGLSLHWSEYDCEVSNFEFSKVDFFTNRLNLLEFLPNSTNCF